MTLRKLKYKPSTHAIERFREYFNVKEFNAVDFANDLMQGAKFVVTQPDGRRLFKNEAYDVMIVIGGKNNTIITVLPSQDNRKEIEQTGAPIVAKPTPAIKPKATTHTNAIIAAAHATIQRELAKARRSFTSEIRKLKIEQAELGVEIAKATVNKVRCMAPHTQALIQERIDASQAYYDVVGAKIAKESAEYNRVKTEAQEFIGMEVSV